MKKIFMVLTVVLLTGQFIAASAQHSSQHNSKPSTASAFGQQRGMLLVEKKIQGFTVGYFLLNQSERNEMLKGHESMAMPGMINSPDVTHNLMLFLKSPDNSWAQAKVGFSITGPDGRNVKTLTMAMYNGYGADVIMRTKGTYKVMTKAISGGKTINDEIEIEIK